MTDLLDTLPATYDPYDPSPAPIKGISSWCNPEFDILIPVAEKDILKLPHVLVGVRDFIPGYKDIWLVMQSVDAGTHLATLHLVEGLGMEARVVYEQTAFPMNKSIIPHRPGWQYQQFLKLFQTFTRDMYLTLDCDIVIRSHLPMFAQDGRPIYWLGKNQHHEPYFRFQELMELPGKVAPFSFVADMNFFDRTVIEDIIMAAGCADSKQFIDKAIKHTHPDCYLGEPELYGSFVYTMYREKYEYRKLRVAHGDAKLQKNRDEQLYPSARLQEIIESVPVGSADIIPIHSWFNEEAHHVEGLAGIRGAAGDDKLQQQFDRV